ncbi:RNA-binding domain-containing protein [Selenomonas ruminantium]|uniref:ATP-dependent DNA helicase RecG n=1 Tax=Selenomonas ruminantium TaxID=971 RepID=A0A1H0RGM5_SELRU|nr:RNA-binding domain-containing protein [Selenomonas ruminantium]SDP28339.1 ATP-dependent DNA helicase RecG [Selenomonas ruminantium]
MEFKESVTLELKQMVVPDLKKEVIAFANTNGGVIYVGIADDGTVIGIEDTDQAMLQVTSMIHDAIKPDLTMFVELDIIELEQKSVLKLTVQKGTHAPYYLQGKGIRPEGVFIRHGAATIPASEDAIRAMIVASDGERYENRRSLRQELTFTALQAFFAKKEIPLGEQQFMTLGLKNRDGIYTNLALLLSEECPHELKIAVFAGTAKTAPFQNRREFSGSLITQMQDAYAMLEQYNQLGAKFEGLLRVDQTDYPDVALREALLNTLIHREYSYSGSTIINIFHDRVEFVSLGGLVQGLNMDDLRLGVSECRNEKMAAIFYRLRLIEAYGTGIPKIFESYTDSGMVPKLEASDHAFRITLPNRNFNQQTSGAVVSEGKDDWLTLLQEKKNFTRQDVERVAGVSRSKANQLIKNMVDIGKATAQGNGKNRFYTMGQNI